METSEIAKHRNGLAEGKLQKRSLGTLLLGWLGYLLLCPRRWDSPKSSVCRSLAVVRC